MFYKKRIYIVSISILVLGILLTACSNDASVQTEQTENESTTMESIESEEIGTLIPSDDEKVPDETDSLTNEENTTSEMDGSKTEDYSLPKEGEGGAIIASGTHVTVPDEVECISLSEEANAEFVFASGVALKNVQFVSLTFDGEHYKREEFIHTIYEFEPGQMVKVSAYLPETYSNLLLQYEDPTGEFLSYFVFYDLSGDNAAVILEDAMNTEIRW